MIPIRIIGSERVNTIDSFLILRQPILMFDKQGKQEFVVIPRNSENENKHFLIILARKKSAYQKRSVLQFIPLNQ